MRCLLAALVVPAVLAGTCADSATLDYPAGLTGLGNGIQAIQGPGFCADDPNIGVWARDKLFYIPGTISVCSTVMSCSPEAGYRLCYCSTL